MKVFLNVIGVLCLPIGVVWILQGINVIKFSTMSGHRRWLAIGSVFLIIGILILILNNRKKSKD